MSRHERARATASRRLPSAWFVAGLLLGGCAHEPDGPAPWFEECAAQRGIAFRHESGHDGEAFLFPEIMGGGAALVDLDGDADLDAYLVQSGNLHDTAPGRPNRLFRNRGDGTFEEATDGSGADDRGYGIGVAAGDVDDDGDLDLYVTNVGPNTLLRNDGAARFAADPAAGVGDPAWSVSAAFFDAENDGDLDLFVVDYVYWSVADEVRCRAKSGQGFDYCSPKTYAAPTPDSFYRNDGRGRFDDHSAEAGLRTAFGNGLGVIALDHDLDGWCDVFVANDGTVNQLWHNEGGAAFVDVALDTGVAVDEHGLAKAGMGVAAADVDEDGDEDLLVVNLARESDSFYRNEGHYFSDRTAVFGLGLASRPFTRFGCGLVDFDDDGRLDLFQANGRVSRSLQPPSDDPYAEENLVLHGVADLRFDEVLPRGGVARPLVETTRGAAFGDVDGDGGIDVLLVNRDAPAHLLRNVIGNRGHWIRARVLDGHGRDAFGARVTLARRERPVTRWVRSAFSYASASDPAVQLGLGDDPSPVELRVDWVDGTSELFGPLETDAVVTLRHGAGRPAGS